MNDSVLQVHNLRLKIAERILCSDLNLNINPGECVALLGHNGTGKTTLLHTLFNLRQPDAGSILLNGQPSHNRSRKALARQMGLLFQHMHDEMPVTVFETALLGRHPHLSTWHWDSLEDIESAKQSLALLDLLPLSEREISTLSGGERQRLAIAMLLVQNPQLYLLDEPSNHLDIAFQIRVLEVLKQRVSSTGSALCMATHDINIAARFCDQVVLLLGDGEHVVGNVEDVLTPSQLSRAFDCRINRVEHEGRWIYFPE